MKQSFFTLIKKGLDKQVPAVGLGVFRIFFSLVILQEVVFLYYFRHLIFDYTPFIDTASPKVYFFLILWGVNSLFLALGRCTRFAAVINYLFWIVFTTFTPMWRDFAGGFDRFMVGSSFLLIFLPTERAFSLDNLKLKIKFSKPGLRYEPPETVSVLSYYIPIAVSVGLVYFDSTIHKLFSEQWLNGLGAWLPATMPYYISAIDMNWLLNQEFLQKLIGYSIIVFELLFIFLFYFKFFRIPLMLFGIALHGGIILTLNIYPFGFVLLTYYLLMIPFARWRKLKETFQLKKPVLVVFYDQQCPLCNRTVIIVEHFDIFRAIKFKGLQTYARQYRELAAIPEEELLTDLYALDQEGQLYSGFDTYIQILLKMKYLALLGFLLKIPGIYQIGSRVYRKVADQRTRLSCEESCAIPNEYSLREEGAFVFKRLYEDYAGTVQQRSKRITKFLLVILLLQLNSTIHYGILYRLGFEANETGAGHILAQLSNAVSSLSHTFLGITPHAFYLNDHFDGYNHILVFTYKDEKSEEHWLPFVNKGGRLVAPNWGRVQSMWANVAVTSHINQRRLNKFIKKVTAFWGRKVGLDLADAQFTIKVKNVEIPVHWKKDLRNKNLSRPWHNIGKVIWKNNRVHIEMSDINTGLP